MTAMWVALVAVLVALVTAGTAAFVVARRRAARRALRKTPTRLRYPLVLAHGVLGFDVISVGGFKREYFNGIAAPLQGAGADVVAVRVPPMSSIAARAARLREAVDALVAERGGKVNIIAHSMGGLDARYAIAHGLAPRVASLTTIGTPHRGTPLADIGTSLLGETLGLRKLARMLGLDVDAFWELTTKSQAAGVGADVDGVAYASVVGACSSSLGVHPLLALTHKYLATTAGANDGLVPASSQKWGDVLQTVEADHWAQIGWSKRKNAVDVTALYVDVVKELVARGF
jgi:triacylglycerol lipase